jgi:putative transcriptional regulator
MTVENSNFENISGKFLIASPYFAFNPPFDKSLIYVASHTPEGAVGLIVNRLASHMPFDALLKMLKDESIAPSSSLPVYVGGPVEPERGFILHTDEYSKNLLLKFSDNRLAVSSNIEILKDIVRGAGPAKSLFVLGYTSWTPSLLEHEMANNMWLVSDYDQSLMFSANDDKKWDRALAHIGIDDSLFYATPGHC